MGLDLVSLPEYKSSKMSAGVKEKSHPLMHARTQTHTHVTSRVPIGQIVAN